MLNCKQKKKHLEINPTHHQFLLTSTKYASEIKICELAHGYNKLAKKKNGEEFMLSPFAPSSLPMHLSDSEYTQKPTISRVNDNFHCQKEPQSLSNHRLNAHHGQKLTPSSSGIENEEQERQYAKRMLKKREAKK